MADDTVTLAQVLAQKHGYDPDLLAQVASNWDKRWVNPQPSQWSKENPGLALVLRMLMPALGGFRASPEAIYGNPSIIGGRPYGDFGSGALRASHWDIMQRAGEGGQYDALSAPNYAKTLDALTPESTNDQEPLGAGQRLYLDALARQQGEVSQIQSPTAAPTQSTLHTYPGGKLLESEAQRLFGKSYSDLHPDDQLWLRATRETDLNPQERGPLPDWLK